MDTVRIPAWVVDHESFRRWARSSKYPEHGWFSYLDGELWVDVSMEQIFTHNLVKTEFTAVVGGLVRTERLGYFFSDRLLLSHSGAGLTTEPDGAFAAYETLRTERVCLVEGAQAGFVELEGSPDMVLEIVSPTSVRKDTQVLRRLYWRAGVVEYWLVDVRGEEPRFWILRRGTRDYIAARPRAGWLKSSVFGRAFRLTRQTDPLGHPQYVLDVKA
jgi:Uma2 family endonuclease